MSINVCKEDGSLELVSGRVADQYSKAETDSKITDAITPITTELSTTNANLNTVSQKVAGLKGVLDFNGNANFSNGVTTAFNGKADGVYLLNGAVDYGTAFGFGRKYQGTLSGWVTVTIVYNGSLILREYVFNGTTSSVTVTKKRDL